MRSVASRLLLGLVFVIPWENSILIPGLGTLAYGVGLLATLAWVLAVLSSGWVRPPGLFHAAASTYLAVYVLSLLWAVDLAEGQRLVMTLARLALLSVMVVDLLADPIWLRRALHAYVLGGYVAAGTILWNFATAAEFSQGRYSAAGFNADDAGVILAIGVPIAVHLVRSSGPSLARLLNLVYTPLALTGIALSGTRTALLASIPGLILGLSVFTREKARWRTVAVLGAVSIAMLALVPQGSFERLSTIGSEISSGELGGRGALWAGGLDVFADHPILGVGAGGFRSAAGLQQVAHNSFLSVLVEVGLVGFSAFALVWAVALFAALRHPPPIAGFWLALLATWAIGAFALTWENRKQTWLVVALPVASAYSLRSRPAELPKPVTGLTPS